MGIINGQVWQAPWPQCWRVVVVWVGKPGSDTWMMVTAPSIMGPSPMMARSDGEGKIFFTAAELEAYFEKWDWKFLPTWYAHVRDWGEPMGDWDRFKGLG